MSLQTNIKLSVVQLDVIPGRPDKNTAKILKFIDEARKNQDDIIIFPEMAVPGYFLNDEWENSAFVKDAFGYNQDIISSSKDITVIWGNIDIDTSRINEDGRLRKYNAAFVAQNGKLIGKTHKTLLPKYREFEDARHFYSLRKEAWDQHKPVAALLQPIPVQIDNKKVRIGLILCEDMWSDDYSVNPITVMLEHKADLIINISCSPWTWRKNDKRHRVVRDRLKEHPVPFIYVNNTGIQNNGKNIYLFDGNTTIYNPDGSILKVAHDYQEEVIRTAISDNSTESLPGPPDLNFERDMDELYRGLIYGIRKFFSALGNSKVVLGISGGIDSGLSTTLLTHALGAENVFAVNMPSKFNSETTKSAAFKLAKNLGIHYTSVSIQESFVYTLNQLNSVCFEQLDESGIKTAVKLSELGEENVQARDRGSRILAGLTSALDAVFVNNGNKTEIALGYATLYGDINGAISVIGDLYKSEVYQLARYINRLKENTIIPQEILDLPASAELSAAQNVDEGKGDPINYPYHDKLMRAFIEFRLDPEDILDLYLKGKLIETLGLDEHNFNDFFKDAGSFIEDLEHKWRLFKLSIFKRIQSPPIITVSKRAFGFDLRESQNSAHFTRNYSQLKKSILSGI